MKRFSPFCSSPANAFRAVLVALSVLVGIGGAMTGVEPAQAQAVGELTDVAQQAPAQTNELDPTQSADDLPTAPSAVAQQDVETQPGLAQAAEQEGTSWWSPLWNGVSSIWTYQLTSADGQSVTIQKIITALLLVLIGLLFSRVSSRWLGRQLIRRLDIDPSASATIQALLYYTLIVFFALLAFRVVQVPLTAFTFVGGAIALGIGFGSQNVINNFISGLILLAERPVKVGDLIQLGDLYGNIEHIGARSTRVRTSGDLEIIVPNSSFLQDNVINFTLSSDNVRCSVQVGVAYGSPTNTVAQLLDRAASETDRVAKDPRPIVLFEDFGDNALVFEVHFWIRMRTMMERRRIESAIRFRIDQLFRDEGISIAFPQRDVHLDAKAPLSIQMIEPPAGAPRDAE